MHVFRKRFIVVAATLLCLIVWTSSSFAEPIKLAERTPVKLRLLQTLTSGQVKTGEAVSYEVREAITGPGGQVIVPVGAKALGKVTTSKRRGMFGRSGKLEFTVESTVAVDGTLIPLRATLENSGKGNAGAVVVTALFLTVLGVFVHGRDITIKEGTEIAAYVDKDVLIDPAKAISLIASTDLSTSATSAAAKPTASAAKFAVTSSFTAGTNVIGELRNDGPTAAAAEIIVLIEKDGQTIGAGTATLDRVEVNEKKAFTVAIQGRTDGVVSVKVNAKIPSQLEPPAQLVPAVAAK